MKHDYSAEIEQLREEAKDFDRFVRAALTGILAHPGSHLLSPAQIATAAIDQARAVVDLLDSDYTGAPLDYSDPPEKDDDACPTPD